MWKVSCKVHLGRPVHQAQPTLPVADFIGILFPAAKVESNDYQDFLVLATCFHNRT